MFDANVLSARALETDDIPVPGQPPNHGEPWSERQRQILCIRGLERHAVGPEAPRCDLQHHRVHVGGYDLRLRHRQMEGPRLRRAA